ncbi:hypothetical protein, partial [Alistipes putredinis]|uniref:hypothetical protein n=1 Tax=Alistipes putredinis TaxID=28117 RepID=UPI003A8ABBEA
QFDTSQRVDIPFYTFFAHSPKISLSLSKLPPFDSLADISVGEFFYSCSLSWPVNGSILTVPAFTFQTRPRPSQTGQETTDTSISLSPQNPGS